MYLRASNFHLGRQQRYFFHEQICRPLKTLGLFSKNQEFLYELLLLLLLYLLQEYRNNTLNSSSTTSMLLKVLPIPPPLFFFFRFASQFSREKVVAISNYPFVNFEINSFNVVQVFSDLFPFLSSRNCVLLCSSEGINNHDFPAQHFVVQRTPYHWLPKKIRTQFKRNL